MSYSTEATALLVLLRATECMSCLLSCLCGSRYGSRFLFVCFCLRCFLD